MSQLLSVSRAARLAGVTRAALQKKIRSNEIHTFEGKVAVTDLLRVYPQTRMGDTHMLEKVERIKAAAMHSKPREKHTLPEPEVIFSRLNSLAEEFIQTCNQLTHYQKCARQLGEKFTQLLQGEDEDLRLGIEAINTWVKNEMAGKPDEPEDKLRLRVRDDFLRVIEAQVKLIPSGHEFFVAGADSILEAALRVGLSLNYGCAGGNCGACKARLVSGQIHPLRHFDYHFSEHEKNMGYFLMCSHTAVTDLVLEAAEAIGADDIPLQSVDAVLKKIHPLKSNMLELHLRTPRSQMLRFMAGQYVTLTVDEEMVDCYLASCPCDGMHLVFYMRDEPDAPFIQALQQDKTQGQRKVHLEGPKGNFISVSDSAEPLLLLSYEAGFGPIKSLVEHAISVDMAEALDLHRFDSVHTGHFHHNLCRSWNDALDNFSYTPHKVTSPENTTAALHQALGQYPDLAGYQIYAAGPDWFIMAVKGLLQAHKLPIDHLHYAEVA